MAEGVNIGLAPDATNELTARVVQSNNYDQVFQARDAEGNPLSLTETVGDAIRNNEGADFYAEADLRGVETTRAAPAPLPVDEQGNVQDPTYALNEDLRSSQPVNEDGLPVGPTAMISNRVNSNGNRLNLTEEVRIQAENNEATRSPRLPRARLPSYENLAATPQAMDLNFDLHLMSDLSERGGVSRDRGPVSGAVVTDLEVTEWFRMSEDDRERVLGAIVRTRRQSSAETRHTRVVDEYANERVVDDVTGRGRRADPDDLGAEEQDNILARYLSELIERDQLDAAEIAELLGVEPALVTGYVYDRYDDAAVLERFPGPQDRPGAFRTFPPRRDNDEIPERSSGESATPEAEPEASGAAAWFDIGSEDMRDILAAMPAAARPASYPEPEPQFGSFGLLAMSPEDRRRILEEAGLVEDASRLNVEEQIELLGQRLADLIENERRSAEEIADIFGARPSRVSEYVHSRYQGNDEVLRRYPDPALPDSPDGVSSMTGIAQGIRFASARQAIDDRTRELLDELSAAERDNLLTQYLSHMIESEELTAERIAERLGVEPVRVVDYVHENYERDAAVRGRYPYPEEFRPPADPPPSSPAAAAAPDSAVEAVAAAPAAARRGGDSGVRMGKATYELLRSGGMSDEEINALVSPRNYVNKAQAVVFLNAWRDRHGLPPVDDAGRAPAASPESPPADDDAAAPPAAPEPELAGEDDRVIDAGGDDAARDEAEADEEIADFDIDAPANPLLELGIRGDRRRRLVDDLLLFGSIDDPNVSDEVLNERLINYIRSEIIEGRELPVMARDLSVSPDLLLRFILRRRADLRLRESYIAPFVELDAQRQESAIDDAATTRAAGADDVPESGTPPPSADADGSREGGDFDDEESRVGELEADEPGPATDADDEYDALERRRQYAEELRQTLNSAVIGIAFRRGQIDREEATLALELARRGDLSLDPLAGPPAAADEAEGERIRDIVSRIEFRGTGQELRELQELFERIDSLDAGPGGADPDDDAGVPAPNASRRLYLELGYVARHFDRARRWLGFQTNAERDEAEQRHEAEQAEYEALVQQSREELRPDADIPRPEPLPSYGDFEDALERMTQEAGEASGALETARSRVSPVAGDLSPSLYAQALEDLDEEEQGQASRRIDEIRDRAVAELQLDGTPAQNRRELERWLRERNVAPRPGEVLPPGASRSASASHPEERSEIPVDPGVESPDYLVTTESVSREIDRALDQIEDAEGRPDERKELIESLAQDYNLELRPDQDHSGDLTPAERQDIAYYQLAGLPPEEAARRLTDLARANAERAIDDGSLRSSLTDELTPMAWTEAPMVFENARDESRFSRGDQQFRGISADENEWRRIVDYVVGPLSAAEMQDTETAAIVNDYADKMRDGVVRGDKSLVEKYTRETLRQLQDKYPRLDRDPNWLDTWRYLKDMADFVSRQGSSAPSRADYGIGVYSQSFNDLVTEWGIDAHDVLGVERYRQDREFQLRLAEGRRRQAEREIIAYERSADSDRATDDERRERIAGIWRDNAFNVYGPIEALHRAEGHDADLVGFMVDAIRRNAEEKGIVPVKTSDGYAPIDLAATAAEMEERLKDAVAEGDEDATRDARARILRAAASNMDVTDLLEPSSVPDEDIPALRENCTERRVALISGTTLTI